MAARYINHSGHPHPLVLREGTRTKFRCALCKCRGYGSFYRCNSCEFRIHDTCAECPDTVSFFGHPQHPLVLDPVVKADSAICCDLCEYCIHGIYYGCRLCGLYLHPVCATLPASAISPLHPQHLVTLVPSTAGVKNCFVCEDRYIGLGEGWNYVCRPCGLRLHPWCLFGNSDKDLDAAGVAPLCIRGPGP